MTKKVLSLFTLFAFVLFDLMCTKIVQMPINQVAVSRDQGREVVKVATKSGKVNIFSDESSAQIVGESVIFKSKEVRHQIAIPNSEIESVEIKKGGLFGHSPQKIVTRQGIIYSVEDPDILSIKTSKDGYIVTKKGISLDIAPTIGPAKDVIVLKSEVDSAKKEFSSPGLYRNKIGISSLKLLSGRVYAPSIDPSIITIEEAIDHFIVHRNALFSALPFSVMDSISVKRPAVTVALAAVLAVAVSFAVVALAFVIDPRAGITLAF